VRERREKLAARVWNGWDRFLSLKGGCRREGAKPAMMTFAVGDVHGCVDKLVGLVAQCLRHAGDQPSRFVFIGDYIDRGPDSRAVIDFVMAMQRQSPEVIALRGNHEAMMLNAVRTGDGALCL